MYFEDPTEFEEYLSPIGGDVLIRPAVGTSFSAHINMKQLERAGLFTITADSFRVMKEPQNDFCGLTIPLSAPFSTSHRGKRRTYGPSSAHMLASGHAFDLSAKSNTHFLVSNFFTRPICEYTRNILQSAHPDLSLLHNDVTLTNTGSQLLRSVARAWSLLNSDAPQNRIALVELEDDLVANFVMYANDNVREQKATDTRTSYRVSRVEEFIYSNLSEPITRDQLAEVSET
ncbi:MAG: hypothetical protein ACR2PH_02835, partial [Desulfobulbia bacterium]